MSFVCTKVAFAFAFSFVAPESEQTRFERRLKSKVRYDNDEGNEKSVTELPASLTSSAQRRILIKRTAAVSMGSLMASSSVPTIPHFLQHSQSNGYCSCSYSAQKVYNTNILRPELPLPSPAHAFEDMTTTPNLASPTCYDKPRNLCLDRFFSFSMSIGMDDYEATAYPYKSRLFDRMLRFVNRAAESSSSAVTPSASSLPEKKCAVLDNQRPIILEVGMGTFPNARYYAESLDGKSSTSTLRCTTPNFRPFKDGLDIISLDPNDFMFDYAIHSATKSGLLSPSSSTSLRKVHGVAEALPFGDGTIDAVVGTLTLCSVTDQQVALSEIQRVLKPETGVYLFWEHVLSERDVGLAFQQRLLSPLQTIVADGCHLDRRTGRNIEHAGFRGGVEMEYVMLDIRGSSIISPTVFGIAHA